jgi:hypothetical protein
MLALKAMGAGVLSFIVTSLTIYGLLLGYMIVVLFLTDDRDALRDDFVKTGFSTVVLVATIVTVVVPLGVAKRLRLSNPTVFSVSLFLMGTVAWAGWDIAVLMNDCVLDVEFPYFIENSCGR